jgi:curved DNA-binding protein CbpA
MVKTPYDVLGVAPDADEKAIAAAFRKAAKSCHPDHNPDDRAAEQQFKQIAVARDALKNPELRAVYRYLQLRRRHDRRQWIVTIAGCAVSALVSAGLVSLLQKPSISEPLLEDGSPLVADRSPDVDRLQEAFELASAAAVPAPSQEGEPMKTDETREMNAEPPKDPEQGGDTGHGFAATSIAPAPAAFTREEALPEATREDDGRRSAVKHRSVDACGKRTGRRPTGTHLAASDPCAAPQNRSQSAGRAKIQPRAAPAAAEHGKRPSRPLLSLLGRGAGSPPGAARSKSAATEASRVEQKARPPYAGSNECWTNDGARWVPCGPNGGE